MSKGKQLDSPGLNHNSDTRQLGVLRLQKSKQTTSKPATTTSLLHFAFGSMKADRVSDIRKDEGQSNSIFLREDGRISFTLARLGAGSQARQSMNKNREVFSRGTS